MPEQPAPTHSPEIQDLDPSTADSSSYGRVVRLHFACRAKLPLGSSLRVTSSQLWAPGILTPHDPNGAKMISAQASESALPDNQIGASGSGGGGVGHDPHAGLNGNVMGMSQSVQESYASSVEMVTSPDEWPIWRTRKPVIIALRHHHGRVEHHRYRYMVVNPGASGQEEGMMDLESVQDDGSVSVGFGGASPGGGATTQDDLNAATEVMQWEDPFQTRQVSSIILCCDASICVQCLSSFVCCVKKG